MSEYTTRQILDLIEANGGPEGLDLSGKDLSGIDLSRETIQAELDGVREEGLDREPPWECQDFGGIDLWGANLEQVNLKGADLGGATLGRANLEDADLEGARLKRAMLGHANLRDAHLLVADLEEGVLGGANLERTTLTGASLEGAMLLRAKLREADLLGASLEGAFLWGADLRGAMLSSASLKQANLGGSNLSRLDFRSAGSIEGVHLFAALLDRTQLTKDQLGRAVGEEVVGDWQKAKESYLALKSNFQQLGRYDDASWAYRKERRMEKREAWQKAGEAFRERHWKAVIGSGLRAASDQLVELVCDYGEGIWRVLGTLLFLWVAFAISYGVIAGVWGPWRDTSAGKIRYITRSPIDLLSFSLGAMTTLVPADLEARSTLAMRVLMPLQAMLGIVLAGLLGFVLGNRIRRS